MRILFPIFQECSQYTLDDYWKNIFFNCSYGKFPKGINMISTKNNLTLQILKDKELISVSNDPLITFKLLMNIFKEKLGLKSNRNNEEQKKKLNDIIDKIKKNKINEWKQIRTKKIREQLLLNFVIEEQIKHDLNKYQCKELLNLIKLALLFKSLTSDMIECENNKIISIEGLIFNKKNKNYYLNLISKSTSKSDKKSFNNKLALYLGKYLKEYNNNKLILI